MNLVSLCSSPSVNQFSDSQNMNLAPEEIDHFDRLPDPIVLSIFNKLQDARSLCSSMAVCKRFNNIIPEIDTVSLTIPRLNQPKKSQQHKKSFKNSISRVLCKNPLRFLLQWLTKSNKSCSCDDDDQSDYYGYSYYLPHEVLKSFQDVKNIEIKLPKSSYDTNSNLLKWKAEFGSQIKSCVYLGAKSISRNQPSGKTQEEDEEKEEVGEDSISSTTIGDDELKVRIVWTISCLIAASARHFLIQKTLNDQEKLEKLRIVDESNQGTLSMNSEQIQEFRKSMNDEEMLLSSSSWWSDGRTKLPALRMKMWYAPELKLTESGSAVMKGATLVVIRPAFVDNDEGKNNRKKEEESQDWVAKAFDGDGEEGKLFVEAAKLLLKKKRTCTLEMNSF